MNGLIHASLRNPIAVTVMVLAIVVLGGLAAYSIPIDILPVFKSPAVQTLVFYSGMPAASIEKNITARLERGVVQASGGRRIESRSIVGISIVRNYFRSNVDRSGAMTEVNSLAGWEYPTMPPGTLPPVVLPYDPTSVTPVCLVALDSQTQNEAALFDVGRYEVRPQIMSQPGAISPLVYGGKVRAVMMYLDRVKMQARHLSPMDVMKAVDEYNVFLPTGSAKFGSTDYAIDSNSMFDLVGRMEEIPLRNEPGNATFLRDVATPKDANFIQTNVVRVNGKREVYVPVFRQLGSSTLQVVNTLQGAIDKIQARLTRPGIDLKVVMDQSVYVRHSIESLAEEGVLGAVLCSLVILLFLGEWRMTVIAVLTIPIAVLAALIGLYATGNTLNVMTLAGLSLAIGPMVDSAIICLENTHRHLGLGATPKEAAFRGASEVAMPELVASLCTLLVLAPLAFMPGLGEFLYRPMAAGVAFAMISAYLLSRSFVPSRAASWLKPHATHADRGETSPDHEHEHGQHPQFQPSSMIAISSIPPRPAMTGAAARRGLIRRAFSRWEAMIETGIAWYVRLLDRAMRRRLVVVLAAVGLLVASVVGLGSRLRREFFPEVDSGAFEIYARAASGTRIEETEKKIARVEQFVRETIGDELQIIISEIGVVADLSAAYTPNAGPMDAVVKVQLKHEREHSAQEFVERLRTGLAKRPEVPRPGVRLRRRRHDPLGDERGQVVADQYPDLGQGHAPGSLDRRVDQARARGHRRRGRRPDHPAARLSRVHHRGRPRQGGRPQAEPDRGHEERGRGAELEHPVPQEELLDRPQDQEPVLRRRAVLRGGHRLGRDAARRADHRPRAEPAHPAAADRDAPPFVGADGDHPQQSSVDDRPDDGRLRAATSGMWPTTWPAWLPASASSSPTARGSLTIPRTTPPSGRRSRVR